MIGYSNRLCNTRYIEKTVIGLIKHSLNYKVLYDNRHNIIADRVITN